MKWTAPATLLHGCPSACTEPVNLPHLPPAVHLARPAAFGGDFELESSSSRRITGRAPRPQPSSSGRCPPRTHAPAASEREPGAPPRPRQLVERRRRSNATVTPPTGGRSTDVISAFPLHGRCGRRSGSDPRNRRRPCRHRHRGRIIQADGLLRPVLSGCYASRRTSSGSIRVARRAGSQQANNPTASKTVVTAASVGGSAGRTP